MELISKELLSAVLDKDIEGVHDRIVDNSIQYSEFIDNKNSIDIDSINIHELANKCKKWAFDKGYDIDSFIAGCDIVESKGRKKVMEIIEQNRDSKDNMYNPLNEIKACQWIYENKKDLGLENGN